MNRQNRIGISGKLALGLLSLISAFSNRHRGQLIGCAPATPPGMRVRTGRFAKFLSCESGDAKPVEVIHC